MFAALRAQSERAGGDGGDGALFRIEHCDRIVFAAPFIRFVRAERRCGQLARRVSHPSRYVVLSKDGRNRRYRKRRLVMFRLCGHFDRLVRVDRGDAPVADDDVAARILIGYFFFRSRGGKFDLQIGAAPCGKPDHVFHGEGTVHFFLGGRHFERRFVMLRRRRNAHGRAALQRGDGAVLDGDRIARERIGYLFGKLFFGKYRLDRCRFADFQILDIGDRQRSVIFPSARGAKERRGKRHEKANCPHDLFHIGSPKNFASAELRRRLLPKGLCSPRPRYTVCRAPAHAEGSSTGTSSPV